MTPTHLSISALWFAICSLAFTVDSPFLGYSAFVFGAIWLASPRLEQILDRYIEWRIKRRGR